MGLSPQSGLPQNNRVGDLDSFALPFLMRTHGTHARRGRDAAVQGIRPESAVGRLQRHPRHRRPQAAQGNARAQLALDVFVAAARHWIGSLFLQLNGADALVFTAGIGENRAAFAARSAPTSTSSASCSTRPRTTPPRRTEAVISAPDSRVKVLVIPTNEELVVAREVKRFLEKPQRRARRHPLCQTREIRPTPCRPRQSHIVYHISQLSQPSTNTQLCLIKQSDSLKRAASSPSSRARTRCSRPRTSNSPAR